MITAHDALSLVRACRHLANVVASLVKENIHEDAPPVGAWPPMETEILKALQSGKALPGKQIAHAAGYSYSARLMTSLARMTREGLLIHTADGYKLAEAKTGPPPDSAQS